MLAFQSKGLAQDDPILFINKTSCDIYVDPFCGECPNGGFNQGPVTVTVPPNDAYLFDGECTGDFAYFKFSIDGAMDSWFVAFDDPNCGQGGDCIGVPVPESLSAGSIFETESTCLDVNVKYMADYHPNTQGYNCQVVVYEE